MLIAKAKSLQTACDARNTPRTPHTLPRGHTATSRAVLVKLHETLSHHRRHILAKIIAIAVLSIAINQEIKTSRNQAFKKSGHQEMKNI